MYIKKPENCCHPNCFECPYDDCIWDGLDALDFDFDDDEEVSREVKMARVRCNRYTEKHREERRKKSRQYYYEHKEQMNENSRKWHRENRQRVAAMKRKRWAENPEYYRQKQRDYRARKKKEKLAM